MQRPWVSGGRALCPQMSKAAEAEHARGSVIGARVREWGGGRDHGDLEAAPRTLGSTWSETEATRGF